MLLELAQAVQAIYAELDADVARFQEASGLTCPPGCGQCCLFARVEATVLEFLPLAFDLHQGRQAETLLDRLDHAPDQPCCLLYQAERIALGEGGCGQYGGRPLVCRLFGYAGNRDRQGVARLAVCRIMKALGGHGLDPASHAIAAMPLFAEAGMRLAGLHPGYGTHPLPINRALAQALTMVGMNLALRGQDHFQGSDLE